MMDYTNTVEYDCFQSGGQAGMAVLRAAEANKGAMQIEALVYASKEKHKQITGGDLSTLKVMQSVMHLLNNGLLKSNGTNILYWRHSVAEGDEK